MNTTAEISAVRTQGETHAEPVKLLRRVGSTTVEVTVHFSKTSKETMADIVRRLLEREVDKVA
jgi:orotate phosphoribosyltransferase-like protein